MKSVLFRIIDILFSIVFIFAGYSSLTTFSRLEFPVVGILVALFYVCMAFGMIRLFPKVRYLVYANALIVALVMLGMAVFLILQGTFYYPLLVPLIIYGVSAWYVYVRFKGVQFLSSVKVEALYFIGVILVLVAFLYVGVKYFGLGVYEAENLSGPIGVRRQ
jgi:hypothetical protein